MSKSQLFQGCNILLVTFRVENIVSFYVKKLLHFALKSCYIIIIIIIIIDRNLVNNFCGPPADLFTYLVSSDMSPPGTEGRTGMTDLHWTLQGHCDPSLLCA